MNVRPRCREWIPLSTQQLRLRNLVQIQGQNIQCNIAGEVFIYYTLHSNIKSSAFYISESLPRQHSQHNWMDINCNEILKSNANCVCVKVWARIKDGKPSQNIQNDEPNSKRNELISALSKELSKCLSTNNLTCSPDEILFTWGVYFSGLIPLIKQSDFKCVANSLIFLMNGVYFVSPANFAEDGYREQLSTNCRIFPHSAPNISNFQIDSTNSAEVKCSSDSSECEIQKPQTQIRNNQLLCPTLDVRKSYTLDKLLKLQSLQRDHMLATKSAAEIVDTIKRISVRCITKEQLLLKAQPTSSTLRSATQVHHSLGRTLSVLLDEHKQIDHHALIRAQVLQEEIEILHSRNALLEAERTILSERISQIQERLSSISHLRQEQSSRLHSYNKQLCDDVEILDKYNEEKKAQQTLKERIMHNLQRRISLLCTELRQIYPISSKSGFYTICGIPFPNMNNFLTDDSNANNACLEVSPMSLSVCLGYIAHLVQMISVIINRPLRNPILYKCSRSSIIDVKTLPCVSREFPLYSRSSMPSKTLKYAIYLLNQNVSQLYFDISGMGCEKDTIQNILRIFETVESIERNRPEIENNASNSSPQKSKDVNISNSADSDCGIDNGFENRIAICLSKSASSSDMNRLLSSSLEQTTTQHRKSRSVGSYSDSEDSRNSMEITSNCHYLSDSNISFKG